MYRLDSIARAIAFLLLSGVAVLTTSVQSLADAQHAVPFASETLQETVDAALSDHELIAIGAVTASSEGILDLAVAGDRWIGSDDPATTQDRWHLGSNTKALTALLYAKLVEREWAHWGATLPELFPQIADQIHPSWAEVTIEDLFAHRSGMRTLGTIWLISHRNDNRPITEQRLETATSVLQEGPSKSRDEFHYNNLNYIVAGAAIETILARNESGLVTWEDAMQAFVFDSLELPAHRAGFGFGPPQSGLQGHRMTFGLFPSPVGRGKSADNPVALGPAGTLHATLGAHADLAREFLNDESRLVSKSMRNKLFEPYPTEQSRYAMGWGVYDDPEFGEVYTHAGSNTSWYSLILIAPEIDRLAIVNVNQFGEPAQKAANQLVREILGSTPAQTLSE